jgi:signal transduction histidine kinase
LIGMEPVWSEWRRPPPTAAQRQHDVWIALAVLVCAAVVTVLVNSMGAFPYGTPPHLAEQLAWGVALTASLVLRRRYPITVLLVVGALFIGAQARHVGDNLFPSIVLFLALFTAGGWGRDHRTATYARVGVIVVMFAWLGLSLTGFLAGPRPEYKDAAGPLDPVLASVLYGLGLNLLFFLSAYFFGELTWRAARGLAELEFRTEQLRLSQEQNTRGAIVAERMRIARDLHDVVAHHVSVMGIQAGAARRVLDSDPELARTALQTVEQTARTAIGELRGLLGVLRSDADADSDATATPGLEQVPDLVALARSAGLDVDHGTYGEPRPVPPGVALSAYRVVQEALTNVVKHAAASKVDVRVRYLDTALEVEITDDGRGRSAPDGSGFGLVGMKERVAVHGGEFEAGPRRGSGYLVRASLPTSEIDQFGKDGGA